MSGNTDPSNQLLHGQYSAHQLNTGLKAYAAEHDLTQCLVAVNLSKACQGS